jgi:hypothetical protein
MLPDLLEGVRSEVASDPAYSLLDHSLATLGEVVKEVQQKLPD